MSPGEPGYDSLERSGQPGRLAGGLLTFSVHALAVALVIIWGRASDPPKLKQNVIEASLVSLPSLVRRGVELPPRQLPRLDSPAPAPTEAVHLGKVKDVQEEARKKKEEEEQRKAREEKLRRQRMAQALAGLGQGTTGRPEDERKFKSVGELPIGKADGDELGNSDTGQLKADYGHKVRAALEKEWKISFLTEEELRRLSGRVRLILSRDRYIKEWAWVQRSPNADWNGSVEACVKRFLLDGDKRLPPFPDERFGDELKVIVNFHVEAQR